MSRPKKIVVIVGSPSTKSRTRSLSVALVDAIVRASGPDAGIEVEYLEIAALAPHIGSATALAGFSATGLAAIRSIEQADLLIAATPLYKGTYAGLFKHLIDFVHPEALVGRPVLLAATGGSDRHALAIDQALRPLFAFFRAQTVPSAVYGSEADFDDYTVRSELLKVRIDEAAAQAAHLLSSALARPAAPVAAPLLALA